MHKLLSINTVAVSLARSLSVKPSLFIAGLCARFNAEARHQLTVFVVLHGPTFLRFTYKFETLYFVYVLCHSCLRVCVRVCVCVCVGGSYAAFVVVVQKFLTKVLQLY